MIEWQLVCDALKFCSPAGEVPTAEPTVFVPPTPACAGVDDRAQDCGATNTARPQSCCAGLVCGEGASVRCVEPSDAPPTAEAPTAAAEPTASPIASVTVEPTMSGGTTPEPTTEAPATSEPTMGDTDAPTDDATPAPEPTLPPSSASKMAAVTAAVAVIVAAPLLL